MAAMLSGCAFEPSAEPAFAIIYAVGFIFTLGWLNSSSLGSCQSLWQMILGITSAVIWPVFLAICLACGLLTIRAERRRA